jgi:hypothetical protein
MGDFAIHLQAITEEVIAAVPEAAAKGMEYLRSVAVSKTPIETGNLRSEAEVKVHPDGAEVYYPGPYARYQHYELQLRHDHGGQALYLEGPLKTEEATILGIVAQELGKHID